MFNKHLHYSKASFVVVVVTFFLFSLALFTKGLTHDLLLEAAIFLVSVKLIILSNRINKNTELLLNSIKDICQPPKGGAAE